RNARSKERKVFQQRVKNIEEEIATLEKEQADLVAEIEKPETYFEKTGRAAEINWRLSELADEIPKKMSEWEAAAAALEAFDAENQG
ncbi:MAG: ABC transporter ATP-binding protein, partial [Limisphaerales bacterium]